MSIILCLSGGMGSGKSAIARELADRLNWMLGSFGGFVRSMAQERNIPFSRAELQHLGSQLIDEGWDKFCMGMLAASGWNERQNLIVDGVRHVEAVVALQKVAPGATVLLVLIETPAAVRLERLHQRDGLAARDFEKLEQDSTEVQMRTRLPQAANLRVNGQESVAANVAKISIWLAERQRQGAQ